MTEGMNNVILMGHLGADPELRQLPSGNTLVKLRLATNENYIDKNGERQTRTEWHDVSVWGGRGENVARYLSKGSGVVVEGSLRTTSYEKDGVKRKRTEVVARDVHFMSSGRRRDSLEPTLAPASSSEPAQVVSF